ncbi:NAD(P)-binding protein [Auriculariales sp. MPI-PUGE-AT-0066]|nr:NAD(P)-binding protein [Auriculariales sp. MPI-PUGE-AT-0066]
MSSKNIIVVFGATGQSGGSVARYLLEDGTFAVRAVTRKASSPAAKALEALGAEVVEADLTKPDTLDAALAGAYGISSVTDYFALLPVTGFDVEKTIEEEIKQGKALVGAAKKAGTIQHFFNFTLPHSEVPHFEGKHQINEYLKASGIPRTSYYNSSYFENLSNPSMNVIRKGENGSLELHLQIPEHQFQTSYSVEQSGGWALEAFKHPELWIGKDMVGATDLISPTQMAEVIRAETGKDIKVIPLSQADFLAQGQSENPYVKLVHLTMKYFVDHCQPPANAYDIAASKKQYPGGHDFATFVKANEGFKKYIASLE